MTKSTVTFKWWWGETRELPVELANIDVSYVFGHGHCHSFAMAVIKLTGWKLYGINWYNMGDDYPDHFIVQTPDGRYMDINGVFTQEGLNTFYKGKSRNLRSTTRKKTLYGGYLKIEIAKALPFAKLAIEQYNKMQRRSGSIIFERTTTVKSLQKLYYTQKT